MDEYIKREAVLKIIDDNCPNDKGGYNTEEEMGAGAACCYIRKGVENIPAADVVPKSEVAKEIFAEIEKKSCTISCQFPNGETRVECYQLSAEKLFELKKKYTEIHDDRTTGT